MTEHPQSSSTTPPSPGSESLTERFESAQHTVHVFRSSFPPSCSFAGDFDQAIDWLRSNAPHVELRVVTDPVVADPYVVCRVDERCFAGPLDIPGSRWLELPVSVDQFDEFFRDEHRRIENPVTIAPYNATPPGPDGTTMINDWSRLNETAVDEVVGPKSDRWPWSCFTPTELDVCNLISEVAAAGGTMSIAGRRHSQGGQTFAPGAVVVDITDFDEIVDFDAAAQTIRVQTGVTWDKIQRFIQPHGLSVRVMQAYPYFTVGGSLGVSVHDSDIRFGPLIDTVNSIRVALSDGRVLTASRDEHPELFGLAVGGLGLIGFILDVELQLTDDIVLEQQEPATVPLDQFVETFQRFQSTEGVVNVYARPCFAHGDDFLREVSVVYFKELSPKGEPPSIFEIATQRYMGLRKFFYDLSRRYGWAMALRWGLEQQYGDDFGAQAVSRNNQMRADIRIPGDYRSDVNTDALQEYFVPVDRFAEFVAGMRTILEAYDVNVMSAGIRFVPKSTESVLSYSADADVFGIVLVVNHDISPSALERVRTWTREIVEVAIAHGGVFYLPYATLASSEQLRRAYPRFDEFLELKGQYDPHALFDSRFLHHYR